MTGPPDDDLDREEDDGIDAGLRVLRDVMLSYDWSFLLDVRDPLYTSRLGEALDLLGMSLEATASGPVPEGGCHRSDAVVVVRRGGESRRFSASASASDPTSAVLEAARAAMAEAGLIAPPLTVSGGVRLVLGPGTR